MSDELVKRLGQLDSCAVSDAMDSCGIDGVTSALREVSVPRRVAGRAVTVKLVPAGDVVSKRHLCTAAIEASGPESVIVIDNAGRTEMGSWGGILTLAASNRSVAGVVTDGACRDIDEAREMAFPVYAKDNVSRTARGRVVEEDWNIPIGICGIAVQPNDLVLADGSGICFIPASRADEVITIAEKLARKEALMAEAIREGSPVSEVMGRNYEEMLHGGQD